MKMFHDHSVQSKQRKFIRGHIHNTEKKKKKRNRHPNTIEQGLL